MGFNSAFKELKFTFTNNKTSFCTRITCYQQSKTLAEFVRLPWKNRPVIDISPSHKFLHSVHFTHQNFKFYYIFFLFTRIWCHIVRQPGTNVSEEPAVSIFRLEDRLYYPSSTSKMETARSLRHIATYPSNHTVPHTLQDSSLSWELKPRNLSLSLIIPSSTILQPVKRTSFITISAIFFHK